MQLPLAVVEGLAVVVIAIGRGVAAVVLGQATGLAVAQAVFGVLAGQVTQAGIDGIVAVAVIVGIAVAAIALGRNAIAVMVAATELPTPLRIAAGQLDPGLARAVGAGTGMGLGGEAGLGLAGEDVDYPADRIGARLSRRSGEPDGSIELIAMPSISTLSWLELAPRT